MIYVIDDDTSVRKALARLMKSDNLPVQTFASSKEFFAAVSPTKSDCAVIDINGPGITGLELLRHWHEIALKTPWIVLARHDDEETRVKARQLGAAGYFLKPVDGQALLDTIRFVVDKAGSR